MATFYARGRRTASGQTFDPSGYTAAHRTLPFGSRATVTNPQNGKSITAVINDRGPFTRGVTLDLTHGAARARSHHFAGQSMAASLDKLHIVNNLK